MSLHPRARHPAAIVLGVDSPIGLTVMRELAGHGVPVHAIGTAGSFGSASWACTRFHVRPTGALGDWLPALIASIGAAALFAVSEGDLVELAAMPAIIDGCRILTPRSGPLGIVLDKRETMAHAARLGIDVPFSWQPRVGDDFAAHTAALAYPVVVKWADPGAVHLRLAAAGLEMMKAEYAIDQPALLALLARYAALGVWPLVQRYCPGHGLGQMLFMADGHATLAFQHRRLHEWPPEGGVSTACAVEPLARHADQRALSEALLAAIGWHGPAMVEYRHDPATGRYWLMEINGRFWGSLPLAWHAGAHFAWEGYRRAVLGQNGPAPRASDRGLRARFMIPETRRLARILFHRDRIADPFLAIRPLREIGEYLLGFVDPRTRYYVVTTSDLGPMIADTKTIFRKIVRRGKRRIAA